MCLLNFSFRFVKKNLRSGLVLARGQNKDGVYQFIENIEPFVKSQTLASVGIKATFDTWHSHLGHPLSKVVSQVIRKDSLATRAHVIRVIDSHLMSLL